MSEISRPGWSLQVNPFFSLCKDKDEHMIYNANTIIIAPFCIWAMNKKGTAKSLRWLWGKGLKLTYKL